MEPDAGNVVSVLPEMRGSKSSARLVLLSGIGTSLVTLGLLFAFNLALPALSFMNWYTNYVVPVGAIFVGLAAGSGYGIACRLKGTRPDWRLVFGILALQAGCFFVSHYVEYLVMRNILLLKDPLPFWEYFDRWARGFSFDSAIHSGPPLGRWGYAMRAIEFMSFAACGIPFMAIPFARSRRAATPTA